MQDHGIQFFFLLKKPTQTRTGVTGINHFDIELYTKLYWDK